MHVHDENVSAPDVFTLFTAAAAAVCKALWYGLTSPTASQRQQHAYDDTGLIIIKGTSGRLTCKGPSAYKFFLTYIHLENKRFNSITKIQMYRHTQRVCVRALVRARACVCVCVCVREREMV